MGKVDSSKAGLTKDKHFNDVEALYQKWQAQFRCNATAFG